MLIVSPPRQTQREDVEEAGYLASVSDLMVGVLFVFIIMVVILSQRVEQAEKTEKGKKKEDPLQSAVYAIGKKIEQAGVPACQGLGSTAFNSTTSAPRTPLPAISTASTMTCARAV